MMSSVGILTFHRVYNYGAILQAYALQRTIMKLGYKAYIIDYYPRTLWRDNILMNRPPWNTPRGILSNLKFAILEKEKIRKRYTKTDSFRKHFLNISPPQYLSSKEIHQNPPVFDIYVSGSDQIWNPQITGGDMTYFLNFVSDSKIKIAYAASFGVSELDEAFKKVIKKYLIKYDFLSVREIEGAKIIKSILNKDVPVVLDPVFLLDIQDYEFILKDCLLRDYLLCFRTPKHIDKLCYNLAKKYGWTPVFMHLRPWMLQPQIRKKIKIILDAGPLEFLGLIKRANLVITDSFHATALSIIFQRPFYAVLDNKSKRESRNSRINTLLNILDIPKSTTIHSNLVYNENTLDLPDIDYKHIMSYLTTKREESISFLKNALSEGGV